MKRTQFWTALGLFAFLATAIAALDLMARNERLAQLLMRLDQQVNRKDKNRYSYEHYFPDFEDRLVNEELPAADYSNGGVYLIGTSTLKWSTRFWELPENERSLIHNYGMGATDHGQQYQLVRHLVEHDKLLAAGGAKNMVIVGASYHSTGDGAKDRYQFFPGVWQRRGFYTYDRVAGITPKPVSGLVRHVRLERIRITGCIRSIAYTAARQLGYHNRVRVHDPEVYKRERREWIGPDWQQTMRVQLGEFEAMTDYLQARGVRVAVVILPLGTWEDDLPFERAYVEAMSEICRRKSLPIHDWSKVLDDDDFADSNHPNLSGVDKLHPRFLELARSFLRSSPS